MTKRSDNLLIGCIADDFTGAGDAASFLQKAGLRTILLNGMNDCADALPTEAEAVVIALKSRSIPAEEAVICSLDAVEKLLSLGAEHIYFKYCSTFDSTPDGNIGPVTDALMERMGAKYTVLCPSLPANGRTVRDGILYVHGVPLAESSMRYHPITPMNKSDLSQLMEAQSKYPCIVSGKTTPNESALGGAKHITLVPTYEVDEDGMRIAAQYGHLPLLTGGSGLLEHIGRLYKMRRMTNEEGLLSETNSDKTVTITKRPRLLLAGSCSAMTQKQVKRYLECGGRAVRIDPERLLIGRQTEGELCQTIADASRDILLYSTADAEQVKKCQQVGMERVSALLEELMGRLACHGVERGFTRIVVAGGETSGSVMRALKINACKIGPDIAPGVPEMIPLDKPELRLALKSGNFGDENFLRNALVDN